MSKALRATLAIALAGTLHLTSAAQNLAINNDGSAANASAILDVKSTGKGVLIPRMSNTQRYAIASPATGLMVYQETPDSIGFHYYNGTAWVWLANATGNNNWLLTGNTGTDSALNFLGTTDNRPLMLRQNNQYMGMLNTRKRNYFIGAGAGRNVTDSFNVAIGDSAMAFGSPNTSEAIGAKALMYNVAAGYGNSAMGYEAMMKNTVGFFNVVHGFRAMKNHIRGNENTAIGVGALEADTSGNQNTAVGRAALFLNKKGSYNTAVGFGASNFNDSGHLTTAIGYGNMYYNKRNNNSSLGGYAMFYNNYDASADLNAGSRNTGLGYAALNGNSLGYGNTAVGNYSMYGDAVSITSYSRNTAVGDSSLSNNGYGNDNIAVGYQALKRNSTGSQHVAVGSRALTNTTATYPNTAIGYISQDSATTGWANTSVGSYSLSNNRTGYNNTAIGNAAMFEAKGDVYDNTAIGNDALRFTRYFGNTATGAGALHSDTSGIFNTAVGNVSMYENLSGRYNTAIGTSSLRFNKTGEDNTGLGINAGFNNNGGLNTYVGSNAGFGYYGSGIGGSNTAIGDYAMYAVKHAAQNVAVGESALSSDTTGNCNVALGAGSLEANTSANNNVGIGFWAGRFNLTGHSNVAIGRSAAFFNTRSNIVAVGDSALFLNTLGSSLANEGTYNTAIGSKTLYNNTTGYHNTALGYQSAYNTNVGYENTAIGDSALYGNTGGTRNTAIGFSADVSGGAFTNATAIGYRAMAGQSNSLILGSINGVNDATAGTSVGIGTTTPTATLDVSGTAKIGTNGTVLTEVIKTGIARNFSIGANTTAAQTFTVTNAALGSTVHVSPSAALPNGLVIAYAYVAPAGTVNVVFTNTTASLLSPTGLTFYITVIR